MTADLWPRKGTKRIRPASRITRAPIGAMTVSQAGGFLRLFVANQMPWISSLVRVTFNAKFNQEPKP